MATAVVSSAKSRNIQGIVRRYELGYRSLLRSLIPFEIHAVGPTMTALQQAFFNRQPLLNTFFYELKHCDTSEIPRLALAECMQHVLEGGMRPSELRDKFNEAEMLARRDIAEPFEARGKYDPLYRFHAYIIWMVIGYYGRFLNISSNPLTECQHFLHMVYTTNVFRDEYIVECTKLLENPEIRSYFPDEYNELFAGLLFMERDMYGDYRLDIRNSRNVIIHNVEVHSIGKTNEMLEVFDVGVIKQYGNYELETRDKYDGRWKDVIVRCKPEKNFPHLIKMPSKESPQEALVEETDEMHLPNKDEIMVDGIALPVPVIYNMPLIARTPIQRDRRKEVVFELPNVTEPRTWISKWFQRSAWTSTAQQ